MRKIYIDTSIRQNHKFTWQVCSLIFISRFPRIFNLHISRSASILINQHNIKQRILMTIQKLFSKIYLGIINPPCDKQTYE